MTLPEKLRDRAEWERDIANRYGSPLTTTAIMLQAATEIEALQKEVEHLNKALALKLDTLSSGLSAGQSVQLEKERDELRRQNAELREALSDLVGAYIGIIEPQDEKRVRLAPYWEKARKALAAQPEDMKGQL